MQNESIPDARGPVFCGVDTHADSHWLYVLDWRGRKVLSRQFPADAAGYEALAGAIAAAGEPACIAMVRHRLNRGGDRQANSALHEIARQRVMRDPETAEYAERARGRGKSDREVMRCLKRYVAREAYRALMRPHEIRRPEDASELVAARRAAKVSQVRAASILGTSEKYISMLERGQRELKPIRRAYEAWVEAGLPLDWDRQAFEAERKMDSKKHLAKLERQQSGTILFRLYDFVCIAFGFVVRLIYLSVLGHRLCVTVFCREVIH